MADDGTDDITKWSFAQHRGATAVAAGDILDEHLGSADYWVDCGSNDPREVFDVHHIRRFADEWPRWRGPNQDGISTETGRLAEWPDGGPQEL